MIYGIVHKGDHDVKVGTRSTTEWIREQIMLVRERDRVLCPRKILKGDRQFQISWFFKTFRTTMDKDEQSSPFTILSERHKKWTITITSLVTFVSPVSANIYYPALNEMARELHVSSSDINLTITAFMVGY